MVDRFGQEERYGADLSCGSKEQVKQKDLTNQGEFPQNLVLNHI